MLCRDFAVKPHFSWPNVPVEFDLTGRRVVLQPSTEELACCASLFDPAGLSIEEAGRLICQFLSRLALAQTGRS
jgi:hypothetical protein